MNLKQAPLPPCPPSPTALYRPAHYTPRASCGPKRDAELHVSLLTRSIWPPHVRLPERRRQDARKRWRYKCPLLFFLFHLHLLLLRLVLLLSLHSCAHGLLRYLFCPSGARRAVAPLSSPHFVTLIHPFLTPSPLLSSPPLLRPSLLPPLVSSHSQPEDGTTCYQVKKKKEEEEDKK